MSDDDSGIGFDHQTLNHVIGVTAEDALGEDSSHWSHFKAVPTKRKSLSNKKARKKKLVGINKKQPKRKVFSRIAKVFKTWLNLGLFQKQPGKKI
jgi:hypothetical protein